MSRTLITVLFAYIITRVFSWITGFDPHRIISSWLWAVLDLAIWLFVAVIVYWILGLLRIGKVKRRPSGQ